MFLRVTDVGDFSEDDCFFCVHVSGRNVIISVAGSPVGRAAREDHALAVRRPPSREEEPLVFLVQFNDPVGETL